MWASYAAEAHLGLLNFATQSLHGSLLQQEVLERLDAGVPTVQNAELRLRQEWVTLGYFVSDFQNTGNS